MDIKTFILSIFSLVTFISSAQNSVVKNYTSNNELPSSQVYDVIEDTYGYMWFSTDKGLSRYNGYEFENFTTDNGLPDNVVFDFHKNANGEIWCTTNSSKLFSISGTQPKFEEYKYNDTLVNYGGSLITSGIHFGANNTLYVSYHHTRDFLMISAKGRVLQKPIYDQKERFLPGSILCVLTDDTSEPFFFLANKKHSKLNANLPLKEYSVNITFAKNEAIHFENHGTSVFITDKEIVIRSSNRTINVPQNAEVISSGKIDDDHFWIGFRYGGVKTYSLSGEIKESLFPESSVTQLYVDQQNNTWVATLSKGVFCLRNKSIKYILETLGSPVNSISLSNSDAIYIGYYNGNIDQVDVQGSHQRFYTPKTYHPAIVIYDSMRKINFFSSDMLFSSDRTHLSPESSGALGLTNDNILLVTLGSRGIRKLSAKSGDAQSSTLFPGKRVKDIVEFNHLLYAATIHGLYISKKSGKAEINEVILPNIRIDKLAVFGNFLVVGTHGKGLLFLDKQMKVVHSITSKDGLSSNFISSFYCEKNGSVWVATNNGLNRLKIKGERKYEIVNINTSHGLLSNEVWAVAVRNNVVWVGTQNGVNYFLKEDLDRLKNVINDYHLQWKSIILNDTIVPRDFDFSYKENKLEFNFLGISMGNGSELVYRYKLIGLSNNWNTTSNRKLIFSSLPPGQYELIVQVKGQNEEWSQHEIRHSFQIHPPYWKTWWFLFLCAVIVIGLIYLFFKIRFLNYNKDIVREILRFTLKKLRRSTPSIQIKHNGRFIQLKTSEIHFIKTTGNYLEIHGSDYNYLVRSSVADFMNSLPDKIEFIQVHRLFIVRLDKVQQKGTNHLIVLHQEIPVGRKYNDCLQLIQFL